jgi:hypothetical protein
MIPSILRASLARWAPIPLRLIVGYGFMEHGVYSPSTLRIQLDQTPGGDRGWRAVRTAGV